MAEAFCASKPPRQAFGSLTQVPYEFSTGSHACRAARRPIGLDYDYSSERTGFSQRCARFKRRTGAVAQLGERLICIQEVAGSIPTSSTNPSDKVPTRLGL